MRVLKERVMTAKQKDYLTTREAATILNVAVSTIQLWTNDGLLEAWTTVGGHRRITKQSIENILSKKKDISIVVVEDNEQERMLYERHFELWGINENVSICVDGYAGLIHIGQLTPEIIITDLMMPNMNGFEIIKAIKKNPSLKNCLIISVSALTEDEIKIRGGLPSDVLVYSKPISFDKLEAVIRKRLNLTLAKSI